LSRYTISFSELGRHDVATVGGKNSSLGEMIANLAALGVSVPGGYATTADAYREFLEHDGLAARIKAELDTLDVDDVGRLAETGALIRASILMAAHGAPGLAPRQLERLGEFGRLVGLAFQVQDDILDIEGDASLIGKPVGSDEARCMPTYPAVAGLPAARARVYELHSSAAAILASAGWAESPLAVLADWLLTRRH